MAAASLTPGPLWRACVQQPIAGGRFASASDVVRAALRKL